METKMSIAVEEMFASIDAGDVNGFLGHLAENVTFQFANAPEVKGRDAVMKYVIAFHSTIMGLRHELTGSWRQGDTTILRFKTAYVRLDSREVGVPCAVILHSDTHGKIDDYRIYTDLSPVFADAEAARSQVDASA
jgi:ketosteroid isomerase-like protein